MSGEVCSWCGARVGPDAGFRAYEPASGHRAVFCRLEHVVPWVIKGATWEEARSAGRSDGQLPSRSSCSQCGVELSDGFVLLVHHRGAHRISDGFCGMQHMRKWAGAGGHWRPRPGEPA